MQRWMQSAAGGTNQRLNPAFATVCSRSKIPCPPPDIVPALSSVAICLSPTAAHAEHVCHPTIPLSSSVPSARASFLACCPAPFRTASVSRNAVEVLTPGRTGYAARRRAGRSLYPGLRVLFPCTGSNLPCVPTESAIGAEAGPRVDRPKVAISTTPNRGRFAAGCDYLS